jgi:hypothetical protein
MLSFVNVISFSLAQSDHFKRLILYKQLLSTVESKVKIMSDTLEKYIYFLLAPKSVNKVRSPTPKWLQAACGKLLSDRLVQKDGVLNVLRGVLDLGGDSSDPQKYHLIAQVIANPPSSGSYADLVSLNEGVSDNFEVDLYCLLSKPRGPVYK